ncbi:interleukin-1 receptor-like 2 isoform X6 [Petaurus breviceps papuanus]|uniref:interleukin-1 receptor-like 2 isoform X6 n=1 Tax=Petaurus breviceps papuanus TaxID=3040969 RepID=UPI0036DD0B1B
MRIPENPRRLLYSYTNKEATVRKVGKLSPWELPPGPRLLVWKEGVREQVRGGRPVAFPVENCSVSTESQHFVAGQPFALSYTVIEVNGNVTCYKNSSKTPITSDRSSRVHQYLDQILFLPLTLEDSGIYQFVIRVLRVTPRDSGRTPTPGCYLQDFINIGDTFLVNTIEGRKEPEIIYPRNNSIEVQLGSRLTINCNIKDGKENLNHRSWRVNDSFVDFLKSPRIKEEIESSVPFGEKYYFYTVNISFSEVRQEDYDRPFICTSGSSAAFIMLKRPAPNPGGYLIGVPIVALCVIMFVVCTYHIVKVDIVLWYRSTFHSTLSKEDGKLYDAYVLYPKPKTESQIQDMNILVLKILPEVLERQCGYRLFIFGRDDLPGQAVANVIDENIKLSRRLIIILVSESSSYGLLKNMSEEQITIYNALIQDGMKVILIELEKILDYTDMPESIKYLKQKHGVLQWRGAYTEGLQSAKTKFWKNVRYHMPPKPYPSSPDRS